MSSAGGIASADSLLLVLPLPIHVTGDGIFFLERQACNGLRLWLDNFDRVTICCAAVRTDKPPTDALPLKDAVPADRLTVVLLPSAHTPLRFLRVLPRARGVLSELIDTHRYLHFAIGGLWGDWGSIGAVMAARRGRPAAIWTDRVESAVMRFQSLERRGLRRLYRRFNAWGAARLEQYVIRRSTLGLFHGSDTYRAYAPFSPDPHVVHNIHLGPDARIDATALVEKQHRVLSDTPVRIIYGGRLHPDKGVADWIAVLARIAEAGTPFDAVWYGDGPVLAEARAMVEARGLADRVRFPGPTASHGALVAALQDADIMLFCHKTPESPRCLIEALLSGTPIVGYNSAYPSDLIAAHGGGVLTQANDVNALADALAELIDDRPQLATLMRQAAADGWPMVDVEIFGHRAQLIKTRLAPGRSGASSGNRDLVCT